MREQKGYFANRFDRRRLDMTKDEFKERFIQSGKLTWDKIRYLDFDFMYNRLRFTDSTIAELFEVPIVLVVKKRKTLGVSFEEEDYDTFKIYKQQGRLKWDEINYNKLNYLYNKCVFTDNMVADLFDIPKIAVIKKRKEFGILALLNSFSSVLGENNLNHIRSYLDIVD